ncbi:MAG: outer membrane lipoprotein chaperone LolA [Succinivibrionaceae bacterium]|nr:outer membrane lipoprotein chaperone LolA [Succinivibrionaceae bacterium]MEE1340434.1 outer membrane lipoprotein chaperone LolA [Succinivibrionaceae bacterium]
MKIKGIFASFLFCLSTFASANDAQDLKDILFGVNDYKGSFIQEIKAKDNQVLQTNEGEMTLLRPNNFKLEVKSPDESIIVADGTSVYYFDAMLEQVTIYPFQRELNSSPLILLVAKDDATWNNYEVSKISENEFKITPKNTSSLIAQILIKCSKENGITSLSFKEKDGKENSYTFKKEESTQKITPSDFKYVIPQGVEIDDQR